MILDPKTSKKIFELAKDQQDELEMPEDKVEMDNPAFSAPRVPSPEEEEEEDMGGDNYEEAEEELVRTHPPASR